MGWWDKVVRAPGRVIGGIRAARAARAAEATAERAAAIHRKIQEAQEMRAKATQMGKIADNLDNITDAKSALALEKAATQLENAIEPAYWLAHHARATANQMEVVAKTMLRAGGSHASFRDAFKKFVSSHGVSGGGYRQMGGIDALAQKAHQLANITLDVLEAARDVLQHARETVKSAERVASLPYATSAEQAAVRAAREALQLAEKQVRALEAVNDQALKAIGALGRMSSESPDINEVQAIAQRVADAMNAFPNAVVDTLKKTAEIATAAEKEADKIAATIGIGSALATGMSQEQQELKEAQRAFNPFGAMVPVEEQDKWIDQLVVPAAVKVASEVDAWGNQARVGDDGHGNAKLTSKPGMCRPKPSLTSEEPGAPLPLTQNASDEVWAGAAGRQQSVETYTAETSPEMSISIKR